MNDPDMVPLDVIDAAQEIAGLVYATEICDDEGGRIFSVTGAHYYELLEKANMLAEYVLELDKKCKCQF